MKRSGIVVGAAFLAMTIAGCDGGIPEGPPTDGPMDPQPAEFKEYMKKNAGNMVNRRPTKPASAPEATPEKKAKP